ncbi:Uncharacterised protein [Vibrio cholerae]|nr:Uncharacterised protein [Vibrio cholerae]
MFSINSPIDVPVVDTVTFSECGDSEMLSDTVSCHDFLNAQ